MAGCVTSAKYNMSALVLPQGEYIAPKAEDADGPAVVAGYRQIGQDPIDGSPIRVWVEDIYEDDLETPEDERERGARIIKCQANAIITGGLNSQGTTERWTTKGEYENIDFVELRVGPNTLLRRRDRVTNIRGVDGKVIWLEEDHPDARGVIPPTVFQVRGVAPSLDIFNKHIENFVLLERAENQELSFNG